MTAAYSSKVGFDGSVEAATPKKRLVSTSEDTEAGGGDLAEISTASKVIKAQKKGNYEMILALSAVVAISTVTMIIFYFAIPVGTSGTGDHSYIEDSPGVLLGDHMEFLTGRDGDLVHVGLFTEEIDTAHAGLGVLELAKTDLKRLKTQLKTVEYTAHNGALRAADVWYIDYFPEDRDAHAGAVLYTSADKLYVQNDGKSHVLLSSWDGTRAGLKAGDAATSHATALSTALQL